MPSRRHTASEIHRSYRTPWLRAAVLGANDGIVSTAALMMGVAAADSNNSSAILTAGLASLVAGAMSMAVGEYVSVSSQRDSERADLEKERQEHERFPEAELRELTEIYVQRGLDRELARTVASQLHEHDAIEAHLRDELNIFEDDLARPFQASAVSAGSFAAGAAIPLLVASSSAGSVRLGLVAVVALVSLTALGALGARLGGAPTHRAALRVLVGGGLAMGLTTLVGRLVGVVG